MSMYRWSGDASERAEARAMLESLAASFTEGLDTPDLREAAALLEQMAAG